MSGTADHSPSRAPVLADVEAARARIAGHARRTELVPAASLARRGGVAGVVLKLENRQVTGSFKPRGALNAALAAAERGPVRALVTYSSGNHGQAVALAAGVLGVPCTVVSPTDVLPGKRLAMERLGARVVTVGLTSAEREAHARELAGRQAATLLPPYDDPFVVAGQGTVGAELSEQCGELDVVIVPIGGGGLASGMAVALEGLRPGLRIVGVEPDDADDARRSLEGGRLVANAFPSQSSCDGLRNTRLGELNWSVLRRRLHGVVTVSDRRVEAARQELLALGLGPVEPSGAAALAALLRGDVAGATEVVACVVSGGNAGQPAMS